MQNNDSHQPGERQLKVYSKYFGRTISGVILPEIRLCGKWLKAIGFDCGQAVTVKHEKNKITITIPDLQEERGRVIQ